MEEIFELCHSVTVLRDGALVGTVPIGETSRSGLIRMMAGRDVQEFFHRGEPRGGRRSSERDGRGAPGAVGARPVAGQPAADGAAPATGRRGRSDVAAGEVVGLAGLMGAGRTELLETLFGARAEPSGGEVRVDGQPVAISSPLAAKRAGLALVTEDRKRDGLVLGTAIEGNLALTVMPSLARFGLVRRGSATALALRTIKTLAIRASGPKQTAGTLSGGNQQKVVIGKWLATDATRAAARRADPRHRRWRQGRDLPAHPRAVGAGYRHPGRQLGDAGVACPQRPHPRPAGGPARRRCCGMRNSAPTRSSTSRRPAGRCRNRSRNCGPAGWAAQRQMPARCSEGKLSMASSGRDGCPHSRDGRLARRPARCGSCASSCRRSSTGAWPFCCWWACCPRR